MTLLPRLLKQTDEPAVIAAMISALLALTPLFNHTKPLGKLFHANAIYLCGRSNLSQIADRIYVM